MYKAFLFDLDGTLMETETHKVKVRQVLMRELGRELPEDYAASLVGKSRENTWREMLEPLGKSEEWVKHSDEYERRYLGQIEQGVDFKKGAEAFLRKLKEAGKKLALVTSSSQRMVEENPTLARLLPLFDTIIHMGSVLEHKPSPEPYLKALENLGIEPHEAIAFEDSEAGFWSTKNAGVPCVFVRHEFNGSVVAQGALCEIGDYHHEDLGRFI